MGFRKTIFGIFFSGILIAPSILVVSQHFWQLNQHRQEVKNNLLASVPKSQLVLFSFTPSQLEALNWEHAHEFEYQGMRYDVVQRQENEGKVLLWCWPDAEETALYKRFKAMLKQTPFTPKPLNQQAYFWQALQQFLPPATLEPSPILEALKINTFPYFFSLIPFTKAPLLPPPKLFSNT
jgi:hypothetical protein